MVASMMEVWYADFPGLKLRSNMKGKMVGQARQCEPSFQLWTVVVWMV